MAELLVDKRGFVLIAKPNGSKWSWRERKFFEIKVREDESIIASKGNPYPDRKLSASGSLIKKSAKELAETKQLVIERIKK
jgi:hypothetical protein